MGLLPFLRRLRARRGRLTRQARLSAGLVLFGYVLLHLLNHALGIFSLSLMEDAQPWLIGWFRSLPGTVLLGGAALVHAGLALNTIYRRRQLRMPPWEALQIVLGFGIPPLLVQHVLATRVAFEWFATDPGYSYVIWAMLRDPWMVLLQTALLAVAWSHGCIGVHYWLRIRPWYPRVARALYTGAVLLPVLALVGFLEAGREVMRLDADPAWRRAFLRNAELPQQSGMFQLERLHGHSFDLLIGAVGCVLLWRVLRRLRERRRGQIRITYAGGQALTVTPGPTLLEISRSARVPHASVCGGRSRCSTCRVRVGRGGDLLPSPQPDEARVLARIKATGAVRLACQIRPAHDLEVATLFSVPASLTKVRQPREQHGREIEIAILFADLRGFTRLVESRLPFDTVFLLNRYFSEMGEAITSQGGHVDKFIGDGVMALFGLDDDLTGGVIGALRATRLMSERLARLNSDLAHDLPEPLKIGIGLHAGPAVVGEMGWATALSLTAIGDTVNTASRIEGLTKRFDCELVVSRKVAQIAGLALAGYHQETVTVRGKSDQLEVIVVPRATDLVVP